MNVTGATQSTEEKNMIQLDELVLGNIYAHDNRQMLARLLYVEGDGEEGTVTIEQFGERIIVNKHNFMLKYNPIYIQRMED